MGPTARDLAAAGLDLHGGRELLGVGFAAGVGRDDGSDADLVAVPAFDLDAAVATRIDRQRPGCHRLLAHFAGPVVVVVPARIAARILVERLIDNLRDVTDRRPIDDALSHADTIAIAASIASRLS